ncbi:SusC/RagA family TonB-linked outer membrane protein [Pedobacter frigoris]|uniref:SusC/RagA family TonB-linked outer membrane protein n=1 Tax=Pedobacter frigoris TaxID=2571272 RepID=UPI002930F44E|nr:SusC/RagA family TonB-linked outer membrane protein [Pedobacter frigoris]
MKLTFLMVMIACLNVSAKVFSQEKLSFDMKNMQLSKALKLIEKQSSFRFVYSPTEGPFDKQISVKVNKAPIADILDQLLEGTALVYRIEENNLITIASKSNMLKDITVTGIVTDATGVPLPGVSVSVKGVKGLGAMTDGTGKFSLKVPDNAILVFSFISFETQEVAAVAGTTMRIQLKESNNNLDEIVVQAYGTTTKRKATSAISTLDMNNVAPLPVQSINDAVAGRLPGVIVTASNGAPGTKSSISIRGQSPIYVIDNIVRSGNDFANLNPNDIESYSILKDAGATALYGNQGANGVVLVTTKRGKEGVTNINYAYNQIFSEPTLFPEKISSYDQAVALNRLYADEGRSPFRSEADLEKLRTGSDPFNFPNTDWQALTMKKFAPEMRHDLSVTSGTKKLTYYAGLSYYDQGSILKTDNNYNKRTTYRLNTTSEFENINLKVTAGLDGFIESNLQPGAGYGNIYSHIQNRGSAQLAVNEFGLPTTQPDNPVRELDPQSGYNKSFAKILNTNLGLEYAAHFLDGLRFKVNGTYTTYNNVSKGWNYLAPAYNLNSTTPIYGNPPSLSVGQGQGSTLTLQGYVLYNKTFGDHSIDFTGVYEQQRDESSSISGSKRNYQIIFDQLVAGPALDQSVGGGESEAARAGVLGRLNYSYKSRYSIEGSVRRDGDYLFPPGKQWGTFYAVSANYIISDEPFMQSLKEKHILDFLKLRGSYGVLGDKSGVAAFDYVPSYGINATAYVVNGNLVQGTSEPGSLPSNTYSWQTVASRDIALEFATLNNRLSGTFDYYYTRRTGYVTGDPRYSETLGIGLPRINFKEGARRTEGFDFNINWDSKVGDLTYKIGLNFTRYNSLWERNPGDSDATLKNPYTRLTNRTDAYLQTGYLNNGLYTSNDQLLTGARRVSSTNVVAGDLRFQDINGDGQLTGDDQIRIGNNVFPRTNYGVTVDLGYKGFSFSAVVQGAGNRDRYIGNVINGADLQNQFFYSFQTDYWRPDNTDALFPRAISGSTVNGGNSFVATDYWLIKSKYVRLKYVQLGYDFKEGMLKKGPFQKLRLFVSGTNLLASSNSMKYFIDPESDTNNYNYPIQRTFAVGLNVGF